MLQIKVNLYFPIYVLFALLNIKSTTLYLLFRRFCPPPSKKNSCVRAWLVAYSNIGKSRSGQKSKKTEEKKKKVLSLYEFQAIFSVIFLFWIKYREITLKPNMHLLVAYFKYWAIHKWPKSKKTEEKKKERYLYMNLRLFLM